MEGSGGGGLEDAAHFSDGIVLGNLQGVSEALLLSSCVPQRGTIAASSSTFNGGGIR